MKKNIIGISTLTLVTLYGLLGAIIILAFILAGGSVLVGIGVSLVVLVLQFFISPWLTDLSMKWIYRAQFGEAIPDYLRTFIEAECQKHNVKYPKIAIIHDGAPNAFTYGRTKKDARLVLTEGIFNLLNEREVIAVVGHEIGHIVHYDMLFMTAVQAVPLILYGIYEMLAKRNNDNDNNKAALVGYVAYILYLISQYIILYLSRTREYFADAFSVDETNFAYIRIVLHHEFFHFIDFADDQSYDDEEFESLNEGGFEYGEGGDSERQWIKLDKNVRGFINHYSTTDLAEDRAEIYQYLIGCPDEALNNGDIIVRKKAKRIKDFLNNFDKEGIGNIKNNFWNDLIDFRKHYPYKEAVFQGNVSH